MFMRPNQDLCGYLIEMFQQHDELEHNNKSFTKARFLDLIVEGLSGEYEPYL